MTFSEKNRECFAQTAEALINYIELIYDGNRY